MEHLFGEIRNGIVHLNALGDIATDEWFRTESIRDNVRLDAFVVMPNHVHGIIHITKRAVGAYRDTPLKQNEMDGKNRANVDSPLRFRKGKPLKSPSIIWGALFAGINPR